MLGWSLFAFAGAYGWTVVPIAAGALLLVWRSRPHILAPGMRTLDIAVIACVVVTAAQLIPLPQATRLAISPSLAPVERAIYFDAQDPAGRASGTLSVDPSATRDALALMVAVLLVFWSARTILSPRAIRRTARAVAVFGLIASAVAILQHATAPGMLYWLWRPIDRNATPYSPFVNKNDLAAWLVMAIPLTAGYIGTRIESRRRDGVPMPVTATFDDTGMWLFGGLCAMTAGLLASVSRSGLTAGVVAAITFAVLTRKRTAGRGRVWLIASVTVVVLVATAFVNLDLVWSRLHDAMVLGVGDRRLIWAQTRVIIDDFRTVGVGVGAYARAMSVYQPPHVFSFNHAHDEYLQILAEGGIVLSSCVGIAVLALAGATARALADDRTPVFWIRAGAASGLAAIAVQNIWETGLRMPANAVLFAVCCAMALHRPDSAHVQ